MYFNQILSFWLFTEKLPISENKFNPLAKHLAALLDFVKRMVKLQSSCKGGTVHEIKMKLELFANQIVKNATLPLRDCLQLVGKL